MRIVVDVSPLSHPPTGIGNYIRGSLAGIVEAAGRAHEIVAFAPTSLQGAGPHQGGDRPHAGRDEALAGARLARRAYRLEQARPPCRRAAARLVRRAPLHRLDDAAPALRPPGDDDPRPQSARITPSGAPRGRSRCTGARMRMRSRHATSSSRTRATRRTMRRRRSGSRRSASSSRTRASARSSCPRASGRRSTGRTCSASGRSSRARTCSASSTRGACSAVSTVSCLPAGAGWGEQPGLDDPGIVLPGYVSSQALPALYRGAARLRLPLAVRGLRDPGRRGDGVRDAGRRLEPSVARRGVRIGCSPCRPAGSRRRSRRGSEEAIARRDELVPAGIEHAAQFTWRATGATMLEALIERRAA